MPDPCKAASVAETFTVEELWMLYGLVVQEHGRRERAELETFAGCEALPWRHLKARLRLLIEQEAPHAEHA